jgi:uncharacterized repeat protein (TIGR04076 family)
MSLAKCKITVLKRMINEELADAYLINNDLKVCDVFSDGQEFITEEPFFIPKGFCHYAWADIRVNILAVATGGSFPWMKQKGVMIACCTDGLRPVVFKVERMS